MHSIGGDTAPFGHVLCNKHVLDVCMSTQSTVPRNVEELKNMLELVNNFGGKLCYINT